MKKSRHLKIVPLEERVLLDAAVAAVIAHPLTAAVTAPDSHASTNVDHSTAAGSTGS